MYTHNCHELGLCEGFDVGEESLGAVIRGMTLMSDVELAARKKYWYDQLYPSIYQDILNQYLAMGYQMGKQKKGFLGFGASKPQVPFDEVRSMAREYANKYAVETTQTEEQNRQAVEAQRIGTEKAEAVQAKRAETAAFKMPEGVIGFRGGALISNVGPAVVRPIVTPAVVKK